MASRLGLLLCAVLTAGPLATLTPSVAAGPDDVTTAEVPATVRLDEPARGRAAVRALGDDLDVAAAANSMTADDLRGLLLGDRTAWVDTHGQVYFVEPVAQADADADDLPVHASIAPAEAFTLRSKPGSQRVIFLDFDGHLVSGTAWNDSDGVTAMVHPAWTLDGDAATFSTTERNAIISIWARVAEDYAPFDVDVTTLDPGQAAITRTNSADLAFGTRVLVSPSADAASHICPTGCGGVAYLDVFDRTTNHDYFQPAWVFPQSLGNSSKNIAEAASHEAGHNFSLSHDGGTGVGYYGGHTMWAPIMGVGYGKPVVQWSKGDYPGATQTQDDVAAIAANGAPYQADESGGTVATASPLSAATAYITTRTDADVWSLGSCAGSVAINANPAAVSPNLDIELTLLSAAGATVASANPASAASTSDVATGLNASISTSVATGAYFVRVDGIGNGTFNPATGYDDYGSIGAYTLSATGCGPGGVDPVAPGQPTLLDVAPAGNGQSATFSWAAPLADGGSPVTGYVVQRSGATAQNVGAGTTSLAFGGLTPGASYTFTVAATNVVGTGASASTSAVMPIPATAPGAPQDLSVTLGPGGADATVEWGAPASDGGSPLLDYELLVDGALVKDNDLSTSVLLTGLTRGHTYDVQVRARNAVGYGPAATATLDVPLPPTAPSAPRIGAATPGKKGGVKNATVAWAAPLSTGGATVSTYLVHAYRIKGGLTVTTLSSPSLAAATRSLRMRLPKGKYQFAVKAWNGVGWSPLSARSATVRSR